MNWRNSIVGLAIAVCTICVSMFILMATMQSTVLDRTEVKGWLRESKTYDTVAAATATSSAEQIADSSPVAQNAVQSAVAQTFTPDYLQTQSESILDNLYDWMEGAQTTPNLLLSVKEKQPELTANVTSQLVPHIMSLPVCAAPADFNAQNPTCLPAGVGAEQIASQVAAQTVGSAEASGDPLAQGDASTAVPPPSTLASITSRNRIGMWLTSTGAIICIVVVVVLATSRLRALLRLSGRVAISAVFALIIGLALVYYGPAVSLGYVNGDQQALLQKILEPLMRVAAPDIGRQLAVISGTIVALSGGAWIVMMIVRQRLNESGSLHPEAVRAANSLPRRNA